MSQHGKILIRFHILSGVVFFFFEEAVPPDICIDFLNEKYILPDTPIHTHISLSLLLFL